jgi:Fic family protein
VKSLSNRTGFYSTIGKGLTAYQAFFPYPLPFQPDIQYDNELIFLLTKAARYLTEINTITKHEDVPIFIASMIRKEALLSSQIEGTQATIEDLFTAESTQMVNEDVEEVFQYQKAFSYAINSLKKMPLSLRLIKEIHAILLDSQRGQHQQPGLFRQSQNWIGSPGSTIQTAKFVPPPPDVMLKSLFDLEKWIHDPNPVHHALINAGLLHYQFETIHPFLDGNGRLGRMLVMLYLIEKKELTSPYLYLSYALKKHQQTYYNQLGESRDQGKLEDWLKFFLTSISEACETTLLIFENLRKLKALHESYIPQKYWLYLRYIESHPIFTVDGMMTTLKKPYDQVNRMVGRLRKLNLITAQQHAKKNRRYIYESLLKTVQ